MLPSTITTALAAGHRTASDERAAASRRDATIDILRGLAIFMMVAANLAAPALVEPHPFWFRLYGSFAAPLFVLLAGMMVAYTTRRKGYGLKHFTARAAVIMAVAALLDMVTWKFYPFVSVDVLYLIGVAMPLAHLSLRLNARTRWLIVAAIFLCTPLLQQFLGYADYPTELSLTRNPGILLRDAVEVVHHWFLDGWFPLCPWLGFALFGVQLAGLRVRQTMNASAWIGNAAVGGAALLACGPLVWWLFPGPLLTRGGYSELFYPPTPGFVLTALGLALVLFAVVDRDPRMTVYRPLALLGESPLSMYLLHIVIIKYVVAPIWPDEPPATFAALYAGIVACLLLAAQATRAIKAFWNDPPLPIRMLLGS